jgi:tetratricopeptide (TPR) repeat protein
VAISLDQRIVDALAMINKIGEDKAFDIHAYGAAFHQSAQEKAHTVLELLNKLECPFHGQKPVFVSVGGADGEELVYLLQNSRAEEGILLEFNRALADGARARDHALSEQQKKIVVIEGDAQAKITEAAAEACREVKRGAADFVAVTCHAVLHELFDRGPEFHPIDFFSSIFLDEEIPVWFTYREPGRPEKWSESVLLSADCSPATLIALARAITLRHVTFAQLAPEPKVVGGKAMMNSTLAMEVLAKLFYIDDLAHEINERSTAVDHRHLINALHVAIGEEAQRSHRSLVFSVSSPTDSFRRLWVEKKIRVLGINEDFSSYDLPVPESHTRVIAWRNALGAPPVSDAEVGEERTHETRDVLVACKSALRQGDTQLLEACLANSGRYWIESSARDEARQLFIDVQHRFGPDTTASVLARFLNALPDLFNNTLGQYEFSEETEHTGAKHGLGLLLRAERMEYARKTGDILNAVGLANSLVIETAKYKAISPLERYQHGTVLFLLGNLLREGGRYSEALTYVERAESIYLPSIPAHNTELAHCEYASLSCRAMRGDASLKGSGYHSMGQEHRFASALIQLSFAHSAWLLNDPPRAIAFAGEAARGFREIHFDGHADRAELTQKLLHAWQELEKGNKLDYAVFPLQLAETLRGLTGTSKDLSGVKEFLRQQRPGRALGILQFARGDPAVLDQELDIEISPLIDVANDRWRLKTELRVPSLREAEQLLRKEMGIEPGQRIPLLP